MTYKIVDIFPYKVIYKTPYKVRYKVPYNQDADSNSAGRCECSGRIGTTAIPQTGTWLSSPAAYVVKQHRPVFIH